MIGPQVDPAVDPRVDPQVERRHAERPSDARRESGRRTLVSAALIVACGLAVYSNSFTDLFVGLDGKESIRDNPHIRRLWPLSEAMSVPLWRSTLGTDTDDTRAAVARRPVLSVTFALNHRISGLDPWSYHAVNIAIHVAAALLLFGIVRRTLLRHAADRNDASHTWLALAAALIWLVHPLQTESVTYVVQRSESLMGMLMMATLYCAIRSFEGARRRLWQAGSVLACALGMGVKETQLVAPALVLLYDYVFVSGSIVGALRQRWVLYGGLGATCAIVVVLAAGGMGEFDADLMARSFAMAQPRVILHYLGLSLWPDDLYLYVNTSLFDVQSLAQVLVPAAVLVALVAATAWGLLERRWFGYLGAWFFLTLAPSSTLGTDKVQEHRMYVPLAALAVLAVVVVRYAAASLFARRERWIAPVRIGLLVVCVLALGVRAYARNRDYHHEFTALHPADLHEAYTILVDHYLSRPELIAAEEKRARAALRWGQSDARDKTFAHFVLGFAHHRRGDLRNAARELAHVLAVEPDFAYAHKQLGVVLREQGDIAGAVLHLERALRINPKFFYAQKELAAALNERGDAAAATQLLRQILRMKPDFSEAYYELGILAAEREDFRDAAEQFRRAVGYRPNFADAHAELAAVLLATGDTAAAIAHLEQAVQSRPELTDAHLRLAKLLEERKDFEAAARHLRRAAKARPQSLDVHHELGRLLLRQNRPEEAATHLRRAMAILKPRVNPRSTRAREEIATLHTELGMVLTQSGDPKRAVEHFEEAIRLMPDAAQAHTEMGIALRALGDVDRALEEFREAIRLSPTSPDAYKALGIVLRDRGDLDGAAENFETAVRLQPDFADAHNELGWVRREQGDLRAAAEHFERALALRPDFAEARARLDEVQALLTRSDLPGARMEAN